MTNKQKLENYDSALLHLDRHINGLRFTLKNKSISKEKRTENFGVVCGFELIRSILVYQP